MTELCTTCGLEASSASDHNSSHHGIWASSATSPLGKLKRPSHILNVFVLYQRMTSILGKEIRNSLGDLFLFCNFL